MTFEPTKCPFCGSEIVDIALETSFFGGIIETYVFCECGAEGPHLNSEFIESEEFDGMENEDIQNYMYEKAVIAWNGGK